MPTPPPIMQRAPIGRSRQCRCSRRSRYARRSRSCVRYEPDCRSSRRDARRYRRSRHGRWCVSAPISTSSAMQTPPSWGTGLPSRRPVCTSPKPRSPDARRRLDAHPRAYPGSRTDDVTRAPIVQFAPMQTSSSSTLPAPITVPAPTVARSPITTWAPMLAFAATRAVPATIALYRPRRADRRRTIEEWPPRARNCRRGVSLISRAGASIRPVSRGTMTTLRAAGRHRIALSRSSRQTQALFAARVQGATRSTRRSSSPMISSSKRSASSRARYRVDALGGHGCPALIGRFRAGG